MIVGDGVVEGIAGSAVAISSGGVLTSEGALSSAIRVFWASIVADAPSSTVYGESPLQPKKTRDTVRKKIASFIRYMVQPPRESPTDNVTTLKTFRLMTEQKHYSRSCH